MQANLDQRFEDGEFNVRMNPGDGNPFGIIDFGPLSLYVEGQEEAEKVLRAAARIVGFFKALGQPHAHVMGEHTTHCAVCGMLPRWQDHAEPGPGGVLFPANANPPHDVTLTAEKPCNAEEAGYTCNSQAGHDGPEHVAYGDGEECHRWPVAGDRAQPASADAATVLANSIANGTPLLVTEDEAKPAPSPSGGCEAHSPGSNYYVCTLDAGHDGRHEGGGATPLPAWSDGDTKVGYVSDEPAEVSA